MGEVGGPCPTSVSGLGRGIDGYLPGASPKPHRRASPTSTWRVQAPEPGRVSVSPLLSTHLPEEDTFPVCSRDV